VADQFISTSVNNDRATPAFAVTEHKFTTMTHAAITAAIFLPIIKSPSLKFSCNGK
jgi:hypothetical protein